MRSYYRKSSLNRKNETIRGDSQAYQDLQGSRITVGESCQNGLKELTMPKLTIEAWVNADTGKVIIREPYKVIDWTLLEKGGYDVTASSYRFRKDSGD